MEKYALKRQNGFHKSRRSLARNIEPSNEVRTLTDDELKTIIDKNARKYLGINVRQFLQRLNRNKPMQNPAWRPIQMMASLLRSSAE